MDTREIQKLIDFISKSDLNEVNIETAELKLQIKRSGGGTGQHQVATNYVEQAPVQVMREQAPAFIAPTEPQQNAPIASTSHLIEVRAPMIGTFYRSAGPDKANFIEIGDELVEGQTICILEAMKLFNEIESEVSGKIVKILVENATPVEYDQPLFLVDPS
jgi:acetyl-CoA carboxylase biotin carboxyl carrier protein